ncbi:hydroxymethylbilane synthase [Thermodesulfovibrionales bacterium]|nr:hydroxymethylbilane synthase [Thermodesulfovibrionales bacterium]MCL0084542.1 hydroxymethylbilane synthase [Thermodesulfovibrionales bacterium]MCL0105904.1 hydroxymethylbilane synthase [Thermodesulfovibrionales bacterium]
MKSKLIIGARGSRLALWQAEWVRSELKRTHPGIDIGLDKIKTTGDKILDVPLSKVGGKGLFVKEIEEALLSGRIDIAVHSMKDVPADLQEGLRIAAVCEREDPRDAFITKVENGRQRVEKFMDLPSGAIVGTSSLRRSCQLLNIRPDLKIKQLRGNLDTRLRRLDEGQFDAIILAAAGVKRLRLTEMIAEILPIGVSLPAINQGAIGVECRAGDIFANKLVALLNHPETSTCVKAERAFLQRLQGGCQAPIAAYARIINRGLKSLLIMDGLAGSVAGDVIVKVHIEGNLDDAESLGVKLAEELLSRGAEKILNEAKKITTLR